MAIIMDKEIIQNINNLIENKEFQKAKNLLSDLCSSKEDKSSDNESQKEKEFFVQKNLGLCNVNLSLYNDAILNFETAVGIHNNDATSWYYLGILYENTKNLDKAEAAYKNVTQLRDTFPDAYKNLAIIFMKKKDLCTAFEYAQKACKLNPSDYQTYYILSSILITQNCNEKVVEILKKGLELNPEHANMNTNIGGAYLELKEYDKALLKSSFAR